MASPYQDQYGPTLPELVARRLGTPLGRTTRVLAVAGIGAILLVLAVRFALLPRYTHVVHRGGVEFNFSYDGGLLEKAAPHPGEYVRLQGTSQGHVIQSFAVKRLDLPPYSGTIGGYLPIFSERYVRTAATAYPGFQLVEESRARVLDAPGFSIVFRQVVPGRATRYGRLVILPEPGTRHGVVLELIATRAAGTEIASDAGNTGAIKRPFRSFRFGTEGP